MQSGPIFIGGLANSGKTELRLMLEAHPDLCLTRRTYMWRRYYGRFGDLSSPGNFERCLGQMLRNKHIRDLEPDVPRIRREFWQGPLSYARLFGLFHSHHAERMGKRRWGDQLGMVEDYADPIFAGYPDARMIQMIRNPRHVYEEAKRRGRQRPGKVGWTLARWLGSVHTGRLNQQRYPGAYKIVRYERLMAQPEETLCELCAFIGEDFVPAMLSAMDTAMDTVAAGTALQASEGDLRTDSAERIRPRTGEMAALAKPGPAAMSSRELAFIQSYACSDLLALGYALEPTVLSLRDRLLFMLLDWPVNRAGMVAWQTIKDR